MIEDLDGFAEPQVLGRIGEAHAPAGCDGGEALSQRPRRAYRELRRNQHYGAISQVREQRFHLGSYIGMISPVLVVDRCVEGDPDEIRVGHDGGVGRERQAPLGKTGRHEFRQTRLVQRWLALRETGHDSGVRVEADGLEASAGQACGRYGAEVPQALDDDVHASDHLPLCSATTNSRLLHTSRRADLSTTFSIFRRACRPVPTRSQDAANSKFLALLRADRRTAIVRRRR